MTRLRTSQILPRAKAQWPLVRACGRWLVVLTIPKRSWPLARRILKTSTWFAGGCITSFKGAFKGPLLNPRCLITIDGYVFLFRMAPAPAPYVQTKQTISNQEISAHSLKLWGSIHLGLSDRSINRSLGFEKLIQS